MILTMLNRLLVKNTKLCSTCCIAKFDCDYNLVNFGLNCWAAGQAPDHLIVQFNGVRRCCDDSLIEELNESHCLAWSQTYGTYFGCVENVDIDGSLYNLVIAFGDGAANTWSDIFVLMNSVDCVWNRWPVEGCLFVHNIAGIPCPPKTRDNALAIGDCGGAGGVAGSTVFGYGGVATPIDPSGQL